MPPTPRSGNVSGNKKLENSDYIYNQDGIEVVSVHNGPNQHIMYGGRPQPDYHMQSISDFVCERAFILDPDTYDSAVVYTVLEGKDGQLYLGEYIGD